MNTPPLSHRYKNCVVKLENVEKTPEFSKALKKAIFEKQILTTRTRKKIINDLDDINKNNEKEQVNLKKNKVMDEIVSSEANYIKQLELINKFFIKPIQEKKILKPDEFDILFSNVYTIYNINKNLFEEIKKKKFSSVIKAFHDTAPFFKLYSTYAMQFKDCLYLLQKFRIANKKFLTFLDNQETRPEVQSKLSALLITPIQRIPRYELLLEELSSLVSPQDEEYTLLKATVGKVKASASHINCIVEEQENARKLLEFQRYLDNGEPNFIKPGRKLIKEGVLMEMLKKKSAQSQKLYTVLTNDIIIFCKITKTEIKVNSLKGCAVFPVDKCKIVEILDKGCFKIVSQDQEIVLYHKHLHVVKEWISLISEAIQELAKNKKTLRKESSARRPVKRKDIAEYHEVGVSPGRPLKKRRLMGQIENSTVAQPSRSSFYLKKREAIRHTNLSTGSLLLKNNWQSNENTCRLEINSCKELVPVDYFNEHHEDSFTSKVGSFFGGIGSSVKRLLGFNRH